MSSSVLHNQSSADTLTVPPRTPPMRAANISSSDSELAAPGVLAGSPVTSPRHSAASFTVSPVVSRKARMAKLHDLFASIGHRQDSLDVPKLFRSQCSSETSDGETSDGAGGSLHQPGSASPKTSPGGQKKSLFAATRKLKDKQRSVASPHPYRDQMSAWNPDRTGVWKSNAGINMQLGGTRLDQLRDSERQALRKIAYDTLLKANLGCAINKPKEPSSNKKRQKYIARVRKAQTLNVPDANKNRGQNRVFGISLTECLENDQKSTPPPAAANAHSTRCKSLELSDPEMPLNALKSPSSLHKLAGRNGSKQSSLSDQGSTDGQGSSTDSNQMPWCKSSFETNMSFEEGGEHHYFQFPPTAEHAYNPRGSPTSVHLTKNSSFPQLRPSDLERHNLNVPSIVGTCCNYLEEKGLNTVGLFRVAGSKKRCREIRMEIESGQPMHAVSGYMQDLNTHDVATLLKEYFRDLPSPLLTKELYNAFLNAAKLPQDKKLEVFRCLIIMLPTVNTDTFYVLLNLLKKLSESSADAFDENGIRMVGNKMNAANLATIFAPTILWPSTSPKSSYPCPQENELAISAVETMIELTDSLFQVPAPLQHDMLVQLLETDPEMVDSILKRLHAEQRAWQHKLSQQSSSKGYDGSTIFVTSEKQIFPHEYAKDQDGHTLVKCRETTTHRIIYRMKRTVAQDDETSPSNEDASSNRENSKRSSLDHQNCLSKEDETVVLGQDDSTTAKIESSSIELSPGDTEHSSENHSRPDSISDPLAARIEDCRFIDDAEPSTPDVVFANNPIRFRLG